MDDGRVMVERAFQPSGTHPGLTNDELYWIGEIGYFTMALFKDGIPCRGKNGDMVYVICRPHKLMQDFIPEMREKEIKWLMGE